MADVTLSSIKRSPNIRVPTAIMGRTVTSTAGAVGAATTSASRTGEVLLSGALTANTYKTLLTVSTPGVLKLCSFWSTDATSRSIGLKIVIDGTTVFETNNATAQTNGGLNAVGVMDAGVAQALDRIPFNTLVVSIKSTISETDKVAGVILYDLA